MTKKKKKFFTKFMPPPYTEKTNKMLYTLIENNIDCPDHWPEYHILLVGQSKTYTEAIQRLKLLSSKEFAYSSESDLPSKEKAVQIQNKIKSLDQNVRLSAINNVPKFHEKILADYTFNAEQTTSHDKETDSDSSAAEFQDEKEKADRESISEQYKKRKRQSSGDEGLIENNTLTEVAETEFEESWANSSSTSRMIVLDPDYIQATKGFIEKKRNFAEVAETESEESWANSSSTSRMIVLDPDYIQSTKGLIENNDETVTGIADEISSKESWDSNQGTKALRIGASNKTKSVKTPVIVPASKSRKFNKTKVTKYIKPPYHNVTFENSNELIHTLIQDVAALRSEVRDLRNNITDLIATVENAFGTNYTAKKTFAEEFNLQIPFKTLEDLKSFDEKLRTEDAFNSRFKASLMLLMDKEGFIRKSVTNIIRKYITRELCMQFTAVKKVAQKELFKEYCMCSCILAIVCEKYTLTEDEVLSHLGIVFSNAKDWNGNRKLRELQH